MSQQRKASRVSLLLLVIPGHTARLCSASLPRGRRRVAATTGVPSGWPYYDDTDGEPPGQFCAQDVRILPCAIAFVKVVRVRLVPANALPPVGRVSWTSSLPRPYRRLSTLQRPAALTNSEPSLPELGCLLRMPCNHQSAWRCTDTLSAFCCNPCAPRGGGALKRTEGPPLAAAILVPRAGPCSLAAGNSWDRNPCLRTESIAGIGLRGRAHGQSGRFSSSSSSCARGKGFGRDVRRAGRGCRRRARNAKTGNVLRRRPPVNLMNK